MKTLVFRLEPGADLRQAIVEKITASSISAGWIVTCVGSLTQTHLRFANQEKGTKQNGYFEIVSLTGTVSVNGCHLHMSVSDSVGKTIGGHLLNDNLIYTTAEVVIGYDESLIFIREVDAKTGWAELQIKSSEKKVRRF